MSNNKLTYTSNSVIETQSIAKGFIQNAISVKDLHLVLLHAPIGAGKSVFVKSALDTLGVDITHFMSPSYGIVNEYESEVGIIYHVDLYRIALGNALHNDNKTSAKNKKIILQMLDSLELDVKISSGIVFIEWAQRVDNTYFPRPYYNIYIKIHSDTQRNICIEKIQ